MEICRASKDSIKSQNVFTKLEELGSGSYAKVYKVLKKNDKNDKTEYALKVVNGDLLKRVNKVHEVHIEKRVLQKCSHENIIKIYQTFKSGNNYYFLLEYCSNGSLADFIQETHYNHSQNKTDNPIPNSKSNPSPPPTLSLPLIKFYISSTLLALEHLHSQKILHRDLKPSNLLLTHSSLKLSDFNSSSLFGSPCSSFVGTPEYISPEMLCSQAQSALLDIWALGVVCYELFAGRTPFAAPTEHLIYSQIMQGEYCRNINAPSEAIDFIDKCLKKNPTERLGYNPQTGTIDYSIIKIHEFFKGIDFENLSFPYQQNAENIEHKQKLCKSFSADRNPEEKNFKSQNLLFSGISKNLEAFSTMDSFAQSKSMLFCLIEFLREDHFNVINADKFVKVSEKEEPPIYFDEESHLNLQNNGYASHQDSDVEEGKTVSNRENYCIQINSKQLNDIIEEPEEYQNNDRSSSINSHTLKRILSNEEFKYSIETCRKSKEEAASMKNLERYSRVIKCERVAKKGILFYNERVLTLIAAPRLTYLSNGIEKEIDLNPTTSICKPGEKTFEIINYYPTLKFKFRTKTEEECDEWVSILQKTILSLD